MNNIFDSRYPSVYRDVLRAEGFSNSAYDWVGWEEGEEEEDGKGAGRGGGEGGGEERGFEVLRTRMMLALSIAKRNIVQV